MAPRDDEDDDRGFGGHSAGSHSRSNGKSHGGRGVDDAPNFDSTKLVGEDGNLFGVKVSRDMASRINEFYPMFLTYFSEKGEELVGPAMEKYARQMGKTAMEIERIGTHARNVAGYGIIFAKPAVETLSNIWQAGSTTTALARTIKPLGKEGWECETVQTVKARTKGVFTQNLLKTATGIIGTLPALFTKWGRAGEAAEKRISDMEKEEALKDPTGKKLKEWYRKKESLKTGADPMLEQRAFNMLIDEEEAEYVAKFKKFEKSPEADAVRKQLKDELKMPESIDDVLNLSKLRRYGADTSRLQSAIDAAPESGSANLRDSHGNQIRKSKTDLWNEFKRGFESKNLNKLQEEAVRSTFVKREGAWDREWAKAYDFGVEPSRGGWNQSSSASDRPLPIKEQRKKIFDESIKASNEAQKAEKTGRGSSKQSELEKQIIPGATGLAAGIGSEMAANMVGGTKVMEKFKQPAAWDYIEVLREMQRKAQAAGGNLPDNVDMDKDLAASLREAMKERGEQAPGGDHISYALLIHEIIQRNEAERGRPPIHKHEFEHFSEAKWDDQRIQEMPDGELTAYEAGVARMAKLVQTGQLAAISLNLLVGHRNYKITGALRGEQETAKKAVLERIDTVMQRYRLRDDVDEDKAIQARGGIVITDDEIRAGFGPGGLKGEQRAFTFALLEAVVQNKKKLCELTGMTQPQCEALGAECRQRFNTLLDSAVLELAEQIKKNPEELEKQIKLTDEDKKVIVSLSERLAEQGKDVADAVENREDLVATETAVINAVMTKEQDTKKPGFLSRILERAKHPMLPKPKEEEAESTHGRHAKKNSFKEAMEEDTENDIDSEEKHHGGDGYANQIKKAKGGGDGASLMDDYKPHKSKSGFGNEDKDGDEDRGLRGFTDRVSKHKHKHKGSGVDSFSHGGLG